MDFRITKFKDIQYITAYPNEYKSERKYPLILYLHGAGTRGNNIDVLKNNPHFKTIQTYEQFPFITVAPQCPENSTWLDLIETLKELVKSVVELDYIDEDRVYFMGLSMGGYGTWQLAMNIPNMVAAIVPICGGGMYWNAGRLVNVPVWAFHGKEDATVSVEESEKMVMAVNKNGGPLKSELCMESFKMAYEFFRDKLKDGKLPILCRSWLLFPGYRDVFGEGSNTVDFVKNFKMLSVHETEKFNEAWRVFGTDCDGDTSKLPTKTTLQRNFIEYINAGRTFGGGTGIMLYDGKKVLTRE